MEQAVLVIHGVGNRGKQQEFARKVAALGEKYPGKLKLIDVYWGELAAEAGFIEHTLPNVDDVANVEVRGVESDLLSVDGALGLTMLDNEQEVRAGEDRAATVATAATDGVEVRSAGAADSSAIQQGVHDNWSELTWLPEIADEEILREAGRLAGHLASAEAGEPPGQSHEVRAGEEIRGPGDFIGDALRKVDGFVGKIIGRAGGNLNRTLRKTYGPKFAGFFGDIFAYLYRNAEVHDLIRKRIKEKAPGAGTEGNPIGAIAHSLGGVILFDMAVSDKNPLHIKNFLTFGSQAPFFHAISDRSPRLDEFKGTPVTVPPTLTGKWINLWEPLDLLAFVAARVFRLTDEPHEPDDRMVAHVRESGLWTHSAYWDLPEFETAISDAFLNEGSQ
jgi:hypothetical protein